LLAGKGFQYLALVINGAPQVMHLTIDSHVYFVEVPLPVRVAPHAVNPLASDFRGENGTKTVPPEPHGFVADVDPSLSE
jgi:hypothetical protein